MHVPRGVSRWSECWNRARLYRDGCGDQRGHEINERRVRYGSPGKLRLEVIGIDGQALAVHGLKEMQRTHLSAGEWKSSFTITEILRWRAEMLRRNNIIRWYSMSDVGAYHIGEVVALLGHKLVRISEPLYVHEVAVHARRVCFHHHVDQQRQKLIRPCASI